jgi:fatty acid-binding protein DegV
VKFLAEEAAKLRSEGKAIDQIAQRIENLTRKIELFVALDSLKYISRRVEGLADHRLAETAKTYARGIVAKLVAMANKSPKILLSVKDGKESIIGFSLNFDSVVRKMTDTIDERLFAKEIRRCYVYQSNAESEAKTVCFRINYERANPLIPIIKETEIPLALLAVTGPKLVAAVCIYD